MLQTVIEIPQAYPFAKKKKKKKKRLLRKRKKKKKKRLLRKRVGGEGRRVHPNSFLRANAKYFPTRFFLKSSLKKPDFFSLFFFRKEISFSNPISCNPFSLRV